MGLVDFFSKKNGGRRNNDSFRDQFSSSEDEESDDYDSSSIRGNNRSRDRQRQQRNGKVTKRNKKKNRRKKYKKDQFDSEDSNDDNVDIDDIDSHDVLTREELFDLPARELRKRCKKLHINTSNVFEKQDLVTLLYDHYRRNSSENNNNRLGAGKVSLIETGGNANLGLGDRMVMSHPNNNMNSAIAARSSRIGLVNNEHEMMNSHVHSIPTVDESEQMVEILQEIIPYFNQGDSSIDEIVKDTIDRLPFGNLENRDKDGNSLLLICCQAGAFELVPRLLSKGSDSNAQNKFGETPLHFTAYTDTYSPETSKVLVQHGANAEVKEIRFGCTALHYAASIGDTQLCRTLLEGGASALTMDKNRCNPISYATQSKKQDCIDLLKNSSKWVDSENKETKVDDSGYEADWAQLIDDQSGFPYYYNRNTGNSMWADEYLEFKNSKAYRKDTPMAFVELKREQSFRRAPSSFAETKGVRSLKKGDEQKGIISENASGKNDESEEKVNDAFKSEDSSFDTSTESDPKKKHVEFDLGNDVQQMVSDCSTSSQSSDTVSAEDKNAGKHRKEASLKIAIPPKELKLSPPGTPTVNSKKLVSQESFDLRLTSIQDQWNVQLQKMENTSNEIEDIKKLKEAENKLSHELRELREELAKKDTEVNRLKDEIDEFNTDPPSITAKVPVVDIAIGDEDVRDEVWVVSSQIEDIEEKMAKKEGEKCKLQEECLKLQANLEMKERSLASVEEKQIRNAEQMQLMEDLLQKEKDAKNEALVLMEQTRVGIAGSEEVAQSLEDEKKRGDELVARLRSDIQSIETKLAAEQKVAEQQLEKSQEKVIQCSTQISALKLELEACITSHGKHNDKINREHQEEFDVLLSKHQAETKKLEHQLQKNLDSRNKMELEKESAVKKCEEAERKANDAQLKLDNMSTMVNQAKALVVANEKLHKTLHTEIDKRKQLHNKLEDLKGRIRVYVRVRPLNKREISMNCEESLIKEDHRTCVVNPVNERGSPKSWEFDHCFSGGSNGNTQEDVFKDTKALITSAIDGFNVCIFCYGQTGSGKTYTMFGPSGEIPDFDNINSMDENVGLAPRAIVELFKELEERNTSFNVSVHANMFELYNDNIRDLIATSNGNLDQNLRIKLAEHSSSGLVEVDGAIQKPVENAIELLDVFRKGSQSRSTASTKMNADSSRSHLLATMVTRLENKRTGLVTSGKVTLVDLAGSERVGKSGAAGLQLKEAQSINKSLSALGDVINALTSGNKHIPYRNHPLTMLMSDSLGGNAKTLMFVCCSPASFNCSETTNSLDFAKRCKNVTNAVKGGAGGGGGGRSSETSQVKALKAELLRMKKNGSTGVQRKTAGPRRPGPAARR